MATYYINADTGNDTTGTGASGTPWLTLSKAHTSAASGDTIIVQTATAAYTFATLTFAKNLTIQGESGDPADQIFDGNTLTVKWDFAGYTVAISYLTFRDALGVAGGYAIFDIEDTNTNVTFETCVFDSDLYVEYASSSDATGGLIGCRGAMNANVDVVIRSCLFNDIKKVTGETSGFIIGMFRPAATCSLLVEGCTFYLATATVNNLAGVFCFSSLPSAAFSFTIKNTIIENATGNTISFDLADTSPPMIYTASITYSCLHNISTTPTLGTGSITSDPLFVDPANGNFHLRPASPCRGTGTLV